MKFNLQVHSFSHVEFISCATSFQTALSTWHKQYFLCHRSKKDLRSQAKVINFFTSIMVERQKPQCTKIPTGQDHSQFTIICAFPRSVIPLCQFGKSVHIHLHSDNHSLLKHTAFGGRPYISCHQVHIFLSLPLLLTSNLQISLILTTYNKYKYKCTCIILLIHLW